MSRGIQRNLEPAVERAVFIWWILLIFGVLWIILPRAANLASKQQLLFQVLEPPSACVCQETLWQKKRFVFVVQRLFFNRERSDTYVGIGIALHTCVIRSIFCLFLGTLEKIPLKYDLWKISEHQVLIVNNWISIQSRDHFTMQSSSLWHHWCSPVIFLPASFRPISLHSADIKYHWLSVILVCRCCHATHPPFWSNR